MIGYGTCLKSLTTGEETIRCYGIEATARMGFWEWLKQDDFQRSYVVYEKRID
jgi:hypothetical protein